MAVINDIPADSVVLTPSVVFTGVYNINTGLYEFDEQYKPLIGNCVAGSIYLFESYHISASIDNSVYVGALLDVPVSARVKYASDGFKSQYFEEVFAADSIDRRIDTSVLSYTGQDGEAFEVSVFGSLKKTADLIDVDEIRVRFSAVVHRCPKSDYTEHLKRQFNA